MSSAVYAAKRATRARVMGLVKAMPRQQIASESEFIQKRVLESAVYRRSKKIGCYIAMENGNEVDTSMIVRDILRPSSGKQLWVPFVKKGCSAMRMLRVESEEDLEPCELFPGVFIRQPKSPETRPDILETGDVLDLVLVPGVAFDKAGARLGRGKGFYDGYLQRSEEFANNHEMQRPRTLGLALSVQVLPQGEVPMSASDEVLEALVVGNEA